MEDAGDSSHDPELIIFLDIAACIISQLFSKWLIAVP